MYIGRADSGMLFLSARIYHVEVVAEVVPLRERHES
jgi:hypothetical protein